MRLRSSAFSNQAEIPPAYTADGADHPPPLAWDDPPPGTRSLALIVDDPDAPDPRAPQTTWVHWVVYGIPAGVRTLPEGGQLPAGAREGINDWKRPGYGGPSPPVGRHRYFFKLFALEAELPDLGLPTKAALEEAMEGHVLARAELIGTYQKQR